MQRAVDDLIKMATSASIPIGLPTWSAAEFRRYMDLGANLLTIGSDFSCLATQAETELKGVAACSAVAPPSHRRAYVSSIVPHATLRF